MNNIEELIYDIYNLQCHKRTPYYNKTKFPVSVGTTTYGEITYEGLEKLIEYFKKYFNKDTIFYDLGCGLGKMVIHIGLKYKIKKSCGIEYSKERYEGCMYNYNLCKNYNKNIEFINGSYYDIPIQDATVIYVDDTAFLDEEKLKKLHSLPPVGCLVLHRSTIWKNHTLSQEAKDFFPTTYISQYPLFYYIKA